MSIQSPFLISVTPAGGSPIVLVPVGGWLAELPNFNARQDLFESEGVNLTNAFFRPLGGVTVSIQFTVEIDHADLLEALEAFLDAGTDGATDLLQVTGSVSFDPPGVTPPTVFSTAVVTAATPALPSEPTATTTCTFQILTTLPE